ncbi:MAG: toll/interleukin-1 receptor domain-containing protein [Candidatus Thiodiazotropha sp. (ex Lucina aurantia)]|nr:toll/interleukin-1 receptor domain-containing protein [Candidatus Thiodiazotropha sp. (ex Lucina pensylvanica)]MBV2100704.1 toll/interleukin-1 receptor domain-containing protein [Candidatus Thiodiazotropha sp. (ex Codakia orbicularis)]MBV2103383.1 toll/interleukin-1 receptor domain-containing protein [Candidatus Thiodiazotropha sp. (ex Lucina aurantia)]MBV2116254.1 toll/interleukin-1 receptor domain-containing protein [Candidatus Thiodiazotropha sp. (ex Lucina aurantia)]
MGTIFISYAREDKNQAIQLAQECEFRGADPWWDRALSSGERYIESILRQVAQADHFVLLLLRASAESNWVAFEVGAARAREFAMGRDFLKIARLDDCEIPGFLGERNATEWTNNNYDGLIALLRSLDLPEDIDYKPPAGDPDKSLTVFRAGGQWMELIISHRGMECVLVDVGEQRSRLQWQMSREDVIRCVEQNGIHVDPPRNDRSWSLFNLGFGGWRWSPTLFTQGADANPKEIFKAEVMQHLSSIHDF